MRAVVLAAAVGVAAQGAAACPTAEDLATGIIVEEEGGVENLFQSVDDLIVAQSGTLLDGARFRHLMVHTDARTAYLVSAVLFAGAHGNLAALPSYLAYALILAWSYERWRTLWVPAVAHAVANGVAVGTILAF